MSLATSLPTLGTLFGLALQPPAASQQDTLVSFDGRRIAVERATLARRDVVGSDTVALDVTYLRIRAATTGAGSPIVFLMGGPGVPASVIARVPPYFTLFERLAAGADVILLDQRGVGLSQPSVQCEPGVPPAATFLRSADDLAAALAATYGPCVAAWRARGFPPEALSIAAIADDIEAIRATLAERTISLLGFSYGTRLALEYAARYPERVDRIVLQGVLGFEHGARLPTTLDSLLDRLSALAARDSVARSLAPDLRAAITDRLRDLADHPLRFPVPDGAGDTVHVTVGAEGLRALITTQLADPRLPALLATLERSDTRVLAQMVAPIYRDLAGGGGSLFGRAVYCSAPPSASRQERARALAVGSVLGKIFDNVPTSSAFCSSIGITPGPSPQVPERLGGRVLFIQGSLDDRTPLGNAADLAPLFADAAIVTVENGGHELLPAQDVQAVVVDFFEGNELPSRTLRWPAPRFMTVDEALQPPRRPGAD